jgi:hypothetical protein
MSNSEQPDFSETKFTIFRRPLRKMRLKMTNKSKIFEIQYSYEYCTFGNLQYCDMIGTRRRCGWQASLGSCGCILSFNLRLYKASH